MIINRRQAVAGLGASALVVSSNAFAQSYPSKPIRLVSSGAGSSRDQVGRVVAKGLAAQLGQPVIVENHDGSVTPEVTVSRAAADGHTLLLAASTLWASLLVQKLPYTLENFAPVTLLTKSPKVLVVHPSLPVNSVQELIAYAKARPGEIVFASSGVGATSHLAVEQFNNMAGIKMTHVPFKQNSALMASMMSGEVKLAILSPGGVMPQVEAGRLKALAVSSLEPSPLVPNLPTITSSGVPGYRSETIYGILAPAGTPAPIINRIQQEVARFVSSAEAKKTLFDMDVEPVASTPVEFGETIKTEMAILRKVVDDIGLKIQ